MHKKQSRMPILHAIESLIPVSFFCAFPFLFVAINSYLIGSHSQPTNAEIGEPFDKAIGRSI